MADLNALTVAISITPVIKYDERTWKHIQCGEDVLVMVDHNHPDYTVRSDKEPVWVQIWTTAAEITTSDGTVKLGHRAYPVDQQGRYCHGLPNRHSVATVDVLVLETRRYQFGGFSLHQFPDRSAYLWQETAPVRGQLVQECDGLFNEWGVRATAEEAAVMSGALEQSRQIQQAAMVAAMLAQQLFERVRTLDPEFFEVVAANIAWAWPQLQTLKK